MSDVIRVFNAGLSSVKFSIFAVENDVGRLSLVVRGAVEGVAGRPHFVCGAANRDEAGQRSPPAPLPLEGPRVETDLPATWQLRQLDKPHEVTCGPHGGLRALVIAGALGRAEDMAAWLRHWGHQVRVAVDGPSALRVAETDPPDVVLLEGALPGASPWEVARRLQGHPAAKRPFLIVLADTWEVDRRARARPASILSLSSRSISTC